MATGIRTGVRRPVVTRAQRLRQWADRHRVTIVTLLGGLLTLLAMALILELERDPLERSLRQALDHTLRGADYGVSILRNQPGPTVAVLVNVFQGRPAQLEAARQVVEGLVDPARGDKVQVLASPFPPPRSLWYWWSAGMASWSLTCLLLIAKKQRWVYRLRRRWRERPAPPPPLPVDGRLAIDVGPAVDLAQLSACIDQVRNALYQDLGVRLPPVTLRQHPHRETTFWEIWLRDRLVHRYDPGTFRFTHDFLARLFRGLAWELTGTQEVDELAAPILKKRADLRNRLNPIQLTMVCRNLLQRGMGLRPFEPILASVVSHRAQQPSASVETLADCVVRDLWRGER